jgi:hypothetical protein
MSALTLSEMQTSVRRNCRNLKTTHPIYTDTNNLRDPINEAAANVVLMALIDPTTKRRRDNFEAFPELRDRRWYDVTVNGRGYLGIPSNCLVPTSLKYTKSTSAYNPSSDTEYIITETDMDTFATLTKTTPGWPSLWVRSSEQLLIFPTPTTSYLTQIVVRGWRKENDLTAPTDTFVMNSMWNPAVVFEATSLTMVRLGWYDDADYWHNKAQSKVGDTISLLGAGRRQRRGRFMIAGLGR